MPTSSCPFLAVCLYKVYFLPPGHERVTNQAWAGVLRGLKIKSHFPLRGETVVKSKGLIEAQVVSGGHSMSKLRAMVARKSRRSNIAMLKRYTRERSATIETTKPNTGMKGK